MSRVIFSKNWTAKGPRLPKNVVAKQARTSKRVRFGKAAAGAQSAPEAASKGVRVVKPTGSAKGGKR